MRVLSYNIHKGIGGRDRRYRLERIIEVIHRERPDLVCLQEVDRDVGRSRHDDQPRLLAEALGLRTIDYQLNHRLRTGGYGNLILAPWPFAEHHHVSLKLGWRKTRGAQLVVVETPAGPLRLVNWHLGLADSERRWQVEHLIGHRLYRHTADLPTLLVGDTNDWRNTLANGPLAARGLRQATAPISRFRTFPAWMPVGALDKAYHCPLVTVEHVRVPHAAPARDASDHLPLVVDFILSA